MGRLILLHMRSKAAKVSQLVMLKDRLLRHSSQRYICNVVSAVGGVVVLALTAIDKLTSFATVLWIASPLLLFWLMDAGLAAEQRRCVDLLKQNPTTEVPAALWEEGGDTGVFRFFRELISPSIWPFYLVLFGLITFGGKEITKANRETEAKTVEKVAPYFQQGNMPVMPQRSTILPLNQQPVNANIQRFTPPPFATPPRFNLPNRAVATPPKTLMTPSFPPASSPAPAVKNP